MPAAPPIVTVTLTPFPSVSVSVPDVSQYINCVSSDEEEEREVEVKDCEVISENVTIRKRKYTNWASVVDSDTESEDEE